MAREMDQINRRFDDVNVRFEEQSRQMNVRFEEQGRQIEAGFARSDQHFGIVHDELRAMNGRLDALTRTIALGSAGILASVLGAVLVTQL